MYITVSNARTSKRPARPVPTLALVIASGVMTLASIAFLLHLIP